MGIRVSADLRAARSQASFRVYPPLATIKAEGPRVFRSQAARDLACLLDVNASVASWVCMPSALHIDELPHIPDFAVFNIDGNPTFFDAPDRTGSADVEALRSAASIRKWNYRLVKADEVYDGFRLRNAKDLLRYGDHNCPLGDRVRLLAALDDAGSLTFAECLQVFRETKPIAGLASMILRDMLAVDLDTALIGPETTVRRITR